MLVNDPDAAREQAMHGHKTILSRHTCASRGRVDEVSMRSSTATARSGEQRPKKHATSHLPPFLLPANGRGKEVLKAGMNIAFFGSSLVSAYWNGAATYYRGLVRRAAQPRPPSHLL